MAIVLKVKEGRGGGEGVVGRVEKSLGAIKEGTKRARKLHPLGSLCSTPAAIVCPARGEGGGVQADKKVWSGRMKLK